MKGMWKALVVVAVFVTVALVSGECASANGCLEVFNQTFDLPYSSQLRAVQQTADGGYIFAGSWREKLTGTDTDVLLLKTDSGGTEQWNRTWGDTSGQFAYAVQQTTDGGYIFAGYTRSSGTHDVLLLKTDSNGTELWNRTFGGSGDDDAYAVQQTTDGGYILAGSTDVENETMAWWIKTDANGTEQWNKTRPTFYFTVAYDVQQTSDGGYILAGWDNDILAGNYPSNAFLIKTDANGTVEKYGLYNISDTIHFYGAYAVDQTADGGYILAGVRTLSDFIVPLESWQFTDDIWLAKVEPQYLDVEWERFYGCTEVRYDQFTDRLAVYYNERAYDVQQTADGGYIVVGYMESFTGERDAFVIKTHSDGSLHWSMTFGSTHDATAYAVQQTAGDDYILAGHYDYRVSAPYTGDGWLIKLKEEVLWGDVNGDGAVNMGDVGLLHNHVHYGYPLIG